MFILKIIIISNELNNFLNIFRFLIFLIFLKKMLENINSNLKFLCKECGESNILGLEFLKEKENNDNTINLYQYCIYRHEKKQDNKILVSNIDEILSYKKINEQEIKNKKKLCENCNKKIDFYCISCKRNLCTNCAKYHIQHNLYNTNKIQISQNKLKEIKTNIYKANNVFFSNLSSIKVKIDDYKKKLEQLTQIYNKYNDKNNKLNILIQSIINTYEKTLLLNNKIEYQIYFNTINLLNFNYVPFELNFDLSIDDYIEQLNEKINSGIYYILSESKYSKNLYEFNNIKINNSKRIDLSKFKIYNTNLIGKIMLDKRRIIGFNEESEILEIYNFYNKITELKIIIEDTSFISILKNKNFLIIICYYNVYIYNIITYQLVQTIKIKGKHANFDSGYFLSNDKLAIIYIGDIRVLQENILNKLNENQGIGNIINGSIRTDTKITIGDIFKGAEIGLFVEDLVYLLIYKSNNQNKENPFSLEKIIILLKNQIRVYDIKFERKIKSNLDSRKIIYCTFDMKSLYEIDENKLLISFHSMIHTNVSISDYFNILDDRFYDEDVFYVVDLNEESIRKYFTIQNCECLVHNEQFNLILNQNEKIGNNDEQFINKEITFGIFNENKYKNKIKILKFNNQLNRMKPIFKYNDTIIFTDDEKIYHYQIDSNNKLFYVMEKEIENNNGFLFNINENLIIA